MDFFLRKKKKQPEETVEELLEAHLDILYRTALTLTRNPMQAEDLAQDTVLRALRYRANYTPGTNFKAWILTIQHRLFINRYRRKKREQEILQGPAQESVREELASTKALNEALDPENTYLEKLLSDDVLVALRSLPDDFRTVITLCDLEGLSYREIADVVDAPMGTVMSRLYRGRRQLEKKLRHVAVEQGLLGGGGEAKEDSGAEILPLPVRSEGGQSR